MAELVVIAFLGGLITGLSPCIVPVLPVVVAGGSSSTNRARPFLIIGGLVLSFSLTVLFATTLLGFLHLPQDFLFWLGVAMLGAISVGLMIPRVGELLERPFARLGSTRYATEGGGFLLGLSLGPVFVPCAGPVLTAITVAADHHRVGGSAVVVTLFYALGLTLPLLVLAVLAQRATTWSSMRRHLPSVRKVAGVVLGVTTLAIAFNWLGALQRDVPGYTNALEDHIESTNSACLQLQHLSGEHQNQFAAANARLEGKKATCSTTDAGQSQSGHLAAGKHHDHDDGTGSADHHRPTEAGGVHGQQDEPAGAGQGAQLHRDHHVVQHAGQPVTLPQPAPGQGGPGRLLDVLLHQLPALAPSRRGLVQRLQERRARRRRCLRPGVLL